VAGAAVADGPRRNSIAVLPPKFLQFVADDELVVGDIVRNARQRKASRAFLRAGPRRSLFFQPEAVKAAVVSCGGLCPGMNNVIRELVDTLWSTYGVRHIYAIQHGFWGFHTVDAVAAGSGSGTDEPPQVHSDPALLTPATVSNIHNFGGTVLGSDRGGCDAAVIVSFLRNRGISQLFVIGGDGTHRGAQTIQDRANMEGCVLSVAAIPKTIDNDVDIIDRSFGFETAYSAAQRAIKTAKTEASGLINGVGVVKLMGRFAGFITAHATLASGDVDLCLIPEVPLVPEGPAGFLPHLRRVLKSKGHAVVVVAEGAGEDLLTQEVLDRGGSLEFDAGGNRKLQPIGPWLVNKIKAGIPSVQIKYIDPSYMVRSVPASPADSILCTLLAQSAVHGAMAGFSGFSTGLVNNRLVYIPIQAIVENSPRRMNPRGRTYERILAITHQPDPLSLPGVVGSTE
jgi:6-phosphofructokinase 1